jgi:hypothetical protein
MASLSREDGARAERPDGLRLVFDDDFDDAELVALVGGMPSHRASIGVRREDVSASSAPRQGLDASSLRQTGVRRLGITADRDKSDERTATHGLGDVL